MGEVDENYGMIAKVYEEHEIKMKKYEALVGTALSQDSFNKFKEKGIEECQKYSAKLLCPSDFELQSKADLQQHIQLQEKTIEELQMEVLFNKSLIEYLLKQKMEMEKLIPRVVSEKAKPAAVPNISNTGAKRDHSSMVATATTVIATQPPRPFQPANSISVPAQAQSVLPNAVNLSSVMWTKLVQSANVLNSTALLKESKLTELQYIFSLCQGANPPMTLIDDSRVLQAMSGVLKRDFVQVCCYFSHFHSFLC